MPSAEYINWVRRTEFDCIKPYLVPGCRILEVGGGTGQQALEFANAGFDVVSIDLPASTYSETRVYPIIEYDGTTFPFPDNSFDLVFSSNTLEHVPDLRKMHQEIKRVLRPEGQCLHVLPTATWQLWSMICAFPTAARSMVRARDGRDFLRVMLALARGFTPRRHGERGTALLELWLFRPTWWRRHFRHNGFRIIEDRPIGIFYTGHGFFGFSWKFDLRRKLARRLGSSTHLFLLQPDYGD
jgi:SAM-dependent methyltransferase